MPVQSYEIGTTYAGRVNVETLTTKKAGFAPKSRYYPYSEQVQTGARTSIGRGSPYVVWQFGFVYADMLNALRAICPGASASVVIRTLNESQTYTYYTATMIWPELDSYEWVTTTQGAGYRPFEIRFDNLSEYTP